MSYDGVRRAAIVLIVCDTLLVAAYLLDVALGYPSGMLNRLVNLDAEGTVAVWFTSAKLSLAGLVFLWLAARASQDRRWTTAKAAARQSVANATVASATVSSPSGGFGRRSDLAAVPHVGPWFLSSVGLFLVFLSLDETVGIHELMTASLRHVDALPRFAGNHGMWIPFLLIGLATFLVATLQAWRRLWRYDRTGTLLLCAGLALGLVGAVSLEIVSYVLIRPAGVQTLYVLEVALEEGLELLGATALLIGSTHVFVTGLGRRVRWSSSTRSDPTLAVQHP